MPQFYFLLSFLFSTSLLASSNLSPSQMQSQGCHDLERKSCKSLLTGHCEAIYLATSKASQECQKISQASLKTICGDDPSNLYPSETECVGSKKIKVKCPKNMKSMTQKDVEHLYACPDLHQELCLKLCGSRFDHSEIREFYQTGRKPGLICLDGSNAIMKTGVAFDQDPVRKKCMDVHTGISKWCINHDYKIGKIKLGAFFKCGAKME